MFLPKPSAASASVRSGRLSQRTAMKDSVSTTISNTVSVSSNRAGRLVASRGNVVSKDRPLAVHELHLRDSRMPHWSRAATAHATAGAHHHRVAPDPGAGWPWIRGRAGGGRHLHLSLIAEHGPQTSRPTSVRERRCQLARPRSAAGGRARRPAAARSGSDDPRRSAGSSESSRRTMSAMRCAGCMPPPPAARVALVRI